MKHRHILAFFPLTALALVGCGPDDSGSNSINPASDVELVFSSFTIDKDEQISETLFWDFYRGIAPDDPDHNDAAAWASALREHIDIYMDVTPTEGGEAYAEVRNPLDLMGQVIASGEVANFQEGRDYISERIDQALAGTFNSRSNGARIRFVDQQATSAGAAEADRVWQYPTLGWVYAPEGETSSNKVIRTIQYVARPPRDDEDAEQPELQSLLVGTQFGSATFGTTGYNAPELVEASFTARSVGRMSLSQDFINAKTDTLFISETDAFEVNGQAPDCIRAELDYETRRLTLYTSRDEPARIPNDATEDPDDTMNNEAFCGNLEEGEQTLDYHTRLITERQ
ncbi:hypothetical protein [Marinobacter salicampi]|uniref:hypothetical protein n=1 Tax=Marinobacter salicampi TaxID=435907 RepID=UPI00140B04D9|nr:hypothetical protein [Marinobacter salicampi]